MNPSNPFDEFKAKNKELFTDMGIDASKVAFSPVANGPATSLKFGRVLNELSRSKSFPASVAGSSTPDPDGIAPLPPSTSFTQEAISKKMRLTYAAPVGIIATLYLVFVLLF